MKNAIVKVQDNKEVNIINREGVLVVSSVEVAEHYQKRHDNVMQVINKLISTKDECKKLFFAGEYVNERGREYPCYYMTRDGFSLLTMGFTGDKAVEWKLKYIAAFRAMEQTLSTMKLDSYRIDDPILRAQRWIEEQAVAMEAEKKLKIAAPKAETFDRICTSQAAMSFTEAAKMLGIKRTILIENLERHMYLYRNRNNILIPYAQYGQTGNGIFICRHVPYGEAYRNREGKLVQPSSMQTFITMLGMDKIRRLLKRWKVAVAA